MPARSWRPVREGTEVSRRSPGRRFSRGFTLVEMVTVVAILGVLASIAVPTFLRMQYRAMRAELPTNVDGVMAAEFAYDAAFDEFAGVAEFQPRPTADRRAVPWVTGSGFDALGWSPDGAVRGIYRVELSGSDAVMIEAECDVDGDASSAKYHIHYDALTPESGLEEWKTSPEIY
jgi:prepilin-type N-terminal cleavage/methylation domain-containing protein